MPRAAHSNLEALSPGQKGMICSSRGGSGAENPLQKGVRSIPLCSAQLHPTAESLEDHKRRVLQRL